MGTVRPRGFCDFGQAYQEVRRFLLSLLSGQTTNSQLCSSELPLYVFENGERPKKKKRSRASGEADGGRAKKAKTNGTTQELASAAAAAVHPS